MNNYTWSLFLVFLVLKLTDIIDWSWWYVSMPLWAGIIGLYILAVINNLIIEAEKRNAK